jgi:hypothetical protein
MASARYFTAPQEIHSSHIGPLINTDVWREPNADGKIQEFTKNTDFSWLVAHISPIAFECPFLSFGESEIAQSRPEGNTNFRELGN